VIVGIVALVNILGRDLTKAQDHLILFIGAFNWILGGVVCWAFEGVRFEEPPRTEEPRETAEEARFEKEWHAASDFVSPGRRKRFLPPRY